MPSRVFTRKSDGVNGVQCPAYIVALPPTPANIKGLMSDSAGLNGIVARQIAHVWVGMPALLADQFPLRTSARIEITVRHVALLQRHDRESGGGKMLARPRIPTGRRR